MNWSQFGQRISQWENRLQAADRRIRDLELRGVLLEQGALQAEASSGGAAAGQPTQLFWTTATGCYGVILSSEPVLSRLAWMQIYGPSGYVTTYQVADSTLDQYLTTDPNGYVQWNAVYPTWTTPGGAQLTVNSRYNLSKSGSNYYYDPSGSYYGWLTQTLTTTATQSANGYSGAAGVNTGSYSYCLPGSNGWSKDTPLYPYLCWPNAGPRPWSANTLAPSSGGGNVFFTASTSSGSGYSKTGTRNGNTWAWNGSSWSGNMSGTYEVAWTLDYSDYSTVKGLSCAIYHVSLFGADAPCQVGSEHPYGASPAPTLLTVTKLPSVTLSPFKATYDFTGTAIQTLTGITTVTIKEP